PDKRDKDDALEVPHRKSRADKDQKNRRTNETPSKTLKKRTVAVRSNHSRQVMSHRAKGGDEEINIIRAPDALCRYEHRYQQQRCADVKDQVPPTVENPHVRLSRCGRHSRHSFRA